VSARADSSKRRFSLGRKRKEKEKAQGAEAAELVNELYVPGEITKMSLGFKHPTSLILSDNNPGAAELADEMRARYPELRLMDVSEMTPTELQAAGGRFRRLRKSHQREFFLLYLNEHTFLGELGAQLADEVERALTENVKIMLAHEVDPARGGVEFSAFFKNTPALLLSRNLYAKIAVAFQPGQHRAVSHCLLAKDLGAVKKGVGLMMASAIVSATSAVVKAEPIVPAAQLAAARRSSRRACSRRRAPTGSECARAGRAIGPTPTWRGRSSRSLGGCAGRTRRLSSHCPH